jgi:hypothetical protein
MEKIKLDPETSALILIGLQHGIVALETWRGMETSLRFD